MSPDKPGVVTGRGPAQEDDTEIAEPTGQVRFRSDVEPAGEVADPPRPRSERRRLLDDPDPDAPPVTRRTKVRARKVRRIVRHVEPWSVLKISVLFFLSLFLIICVATALLWQGARSAGQIENLEGTITELGFGNCEDIPGADTAATPETTTTIAGPVDQLGGAATSTTVPVAGDTDEPSNLPDEDGECGEGRQLVGGFEFRDDRIIKAFALGGVVLVLAGSAASVVMTLLFNLISDLTGGMRVTVLEEDPLPPRTRSGSPGPKPGR